MVVAEVVLTQKFSTISKPAETYKIVLKTRWKFRYFVFEGSKWASKTECYKATEFWCFVIKRWLTHKISTEDLQSVLNTVKTVTPPRKTSDKGNAGHLILLRKDIEDARIRSEIKKKLESKLEEKKDSEANQKTDETN